MDGLKVKELRTKAGIGQAELARRSGVSQACISGIESGRFSGSPDTRRAIAEVLNCRIAEIDGTLSEYDKLTLLCKQLSQAQLLALNGIVAEFLSISAMRQLRNGRYAVMGTGRARIRALWAAQRARVDAQDGQ